MKNPIKVSNATTKYVNKGNKMPPFDNWQDVIVAEAKLVLVYLPFEEATGNILCQCIKEMADVKIGEIQLQHKVMTSLDYWRPVKPILISETEKIEVGDWAYGMDGLFEYKGPVTFKDVHLPHKVLALPEHFSPKHLQTIVEGKFKDGDKVLVECETIINPNGLSMPLDDGGYPTRTVIKVGITNHITLHKLEERTYTEYEVNLMLSHIIANPNMTSTEMKERIEKTLNWFKKGTDQE